MELTKEDLHIGPAPPGKPPHLKTHAERIFDTLHRYHDGKFGYVIFRINYDDNAKWAHFMERLTAYANAGLEDDEFAYKIKDKFTWDIFEDEAKYSGASKREIRGYFIDWLKSIGRAYGGETRYTHCIYADEEVIESVLNGEGYDDKYPKGGKRASVKVLRAWFSETPNEVLPQDEPDEELRARLNEGDEGYPPLDGHKRYEVGWMVVSARRLVVGMYWSLMASGWFTMYERPPKIVLGY